MQKRYEIRTLEDAHAVIKHYGLDKFEWGGIGTSEGFANDLFGRGVDVNIFSLADLFHAYRRKCEKEGSREVNARLAEYKDGVVDVIETRNKERLAFANFIREVKVDEREAALWEFVAEIATKDDPVARINGLTRDRRASLVKVLDGLEAFREAFEESVNGLYAPGKDEVVDQCMFFDIARFDVTLASEKPWDCGDPDWFDEAGALLNLASNAELRRALEGVASEGAPSCASDSRGRVSMT